MDDELKQYLMGMEDRVMTRLEGLSRPMESLAMRVEELAALIGDVAEASKVRDDRLVEMIRDVETKLLTEFHKWASPMEERLRSHSAVLRAIDADLEWLRDRVKKLENRPTGT